ncbi:MAG: S46 family peptidase [Bdellovibrio sp.]|nr:MAG: S46 family peptidase [Bdellovibrio sp.]
MIKLQTQRSSRWSYLVHLVFSVVMGLGQTCLAEEGMWTLDHFPAQEVKRRYGFAPDAQWLETTRMSSVRLARGCSGSFVSPQGLVQTNHHCAESCLQGLSGLSGKNYFNLGFYAQDLSLEAKCPDVEVNQLIGVTDVTDTINAATTGKSGKEYIDAKNGAVAVLEKDCSGSADTIRCEVVALYSGGQYQLYKYRKYKDVRLVFAPEMAIAFFGGDPDNFEFPRYDLDVSYMRVYDQEKPLDTSTNFFPYAAKDIQAGELTFVTGHPGSTQRQSTYAQLAYQRDLRLPTWVQYSKRFHDELVNYRSRGAEEQLRAQSAVFGLENSMKALKGELKALKDSSIMAEKLESEKAFREKVANDPKLSAEVGGALDGIAKAYQHTPVELRKLMVVDGSYSGVSRIFNVALVLCRHATESTKPNDQRYEGYSDTEFSSVKDSVLATTEPMYADLEKVKLRLWLQLLHEVDTDHQFLGGLDQGQITQFADDLVDKSQLMNRDVRMELLDPAKLAASTDSLIQFAKKLDPNFRAVHEDYQKTFAGPAEKFAEQLAKARFAIEGTSTYPDATFTLRITYGSVQGYQQNNEEVSPFTTIAGLFKHATGIDPFKLPDSWIQAQSTLNMSQPVNFVTTNDIVGGNSGSPVIHPNGITGKPEVVGLIFDGNIQSLGGNFGYDIRDNRAVAVNIGFLREALAKVYHADRLLNELNGK